MIFEKGKTTLLPFSPDLPQGLRGKSEFAAFIKGVPFHMPQREKTGRRSDAVAVRRVFSPDHEKMRRQLGALFVSHSFHRHALGEVAGAVGVQPA